MAKDPYEILGVPRNATIDEIKAKYKELVKKYHPDKHKDNPLSELAEEKFKEIQEAYDFLVKNKSSSNFNDSYSSNYYKEYNYSYSQENIDYKYIREQLNRGNIDIAENILDSNPSNDAEWYFLKAFIYAKKGSFYQAQNYLAEALSRNPTNYEYLELKKQLDYYTNSYNYQFRRPSRSRDMSDDLCCNCLSLLCCLQCCCGTS